MAATISATGTWSTLTFDTSKTPLTGNDRRVEGMNFQELATAPHPETDAFITAMAAGYGVPFHTAVALLGEILKRRVHQAAPARMANQTYVP